MKKLNHKILAKRKRKIEKRLERRNWGDQERPMFKGMNICYEDDRHKGIACGGIGVIQLMAERFGNRNLRDLNEIELKSLQKFSAEFLTLVRKDSLFRIDGFGSSYTSALLHFHFPTLIPILDRRVINGAGINAEINAQGQVIDIERYYPD